MNNQTNAHEWQVFSEHERLMRERQKCLEQIKAENTLYLPLLGLRFKHIEDECAQSQMNAAMKLLNKSVYILRGTTHAGHQIAGLIQIESIDRSDNTNVCVYLEGSLINEEGVIYEDLTVRVAVHAHTLIRFR